jgi:hypothetical protein
MKKAIVTLLIISVVACLLLLQKPSPSIEKVPSAHPTPVGNPEKASAYSPVAKPKNIPNGLKFTLDHGPEASIEMGYKELETLAGKPVEAESAQALRWLIHQASAPENLRNEALKTLGAWNPDWLVGDLGRMAKDPAQSALWRSYCVQHIGHHYQAHQDDVSLQILNSTAAATDPAVRDQAVYSLALLCRQQGWESNNPRQYEKLVAEIESALNDRKASTISAGLRAAAVADVTRVAPIAEKLASDAKQAGEVHVSAVQALGAIGRADSVTVLESCLKSSDETVARFANISLRTLNARLRQDQ